MKHYKKSLTRHLLNAAKILIPRHWKSKDIPSIPEWLHSVGDIYHMEETVAIARESFEKFNKLWPPWIMFRYSDQYKQIDTG